MAVFAINHKTLDCLIAFFTRTEDIQRIHLSILHSIKERYNTSFRLLMDYGKKPTGVFLRYANL